MKKGEKMSDEQKLKLSLSKMGSKNPMFGKKSTLVHTQETKDKMSKILTDKYKSGERTPYWLGKKRSEGDKEKFSNAHKGKTLNETTIKKLSISHSKERHWNWKQDRSLVKIDKERGGPLHKQWSKDVKNRDNWKCRLADAFCKGKVVAHHIMSWRDFPELHYEINNGITLCLTHHPRKRSEEVELRPVFKELVVKGNLFGINRL